MKLVVKYRYLTGASCGSAGTKILFQYRGTHVSTIITYWRYAALVVVLWCPALSSSRRL